MAFNRTYTLGFGEDVNIPTEGISGKVNFQLVKTSGKATTIIVSVAGNIEGDGGGTNLFGGPVTTEVTLQKIDSHPYIYVFQAGNATIEVTISEDV